MFLSLWGRRPYSLWHICDAWSESKACRWTKFLAALYDPSVCSLSVSCPGTAGKHWAHICQCIWYCLIWGSIQYLWASGQHGERVCEHFGFSLLTISHATCLNGKNDSPKDHSERLFFSLSFYFHVCPWFTLPPTQTSEHNPVPLPCYSTAVEKPRLFRCNICPGSYGGNGQSIRCLGRVFGRREITLSFMPGLATPPL